MRLIIFVFMLLVITAESFAQTNLYKSGLEFSHFIPQRYGEIFKSRAWWNGNYVTTQVHALSDEFRYRTMPAVWKTTNKLYDPVTKWFYRSPRGTGIAAITVVNGAFGAYDTIKIEQKYNIGDIDQIDREIAHIRNISGMIGGLAGGCIGGTAGSAGGSLVAPGPGTAYGGITGGIAGYCCGNKGGEHIGEIAARKFIQEFGTITDIKNDIVQNVSNDIDYAKENITYCYTTTKTTVGAGVIKIYNETKNISGATYAKINSWLGR